VTYHRSKVYSIEADIFISKDSFPEIIRLLKFHQSKNEKLQNAYSIYSVIREFGWTPQFKDGNIISASYRNSAWDIHGITFIGIIGRFVAPGGYIRMVDDSSRTYWAYSFDGKKAERRTVDILYVDFADKKSLQQSFNSIVAALFNLGATKTELKHLLQKIFVNKILK
jgi:hypothetical protein